MRCDSNKRAMQITSPKDVKKILVYLQNTLKPLKDNKRDSNKISGCRWSCIKTNGFNRDILQFGNIITQGDRYDWIEISWQKLK